MTVTDLLTARGIKFRLSSNQVAETNIQICCPFCPERGESLDTRFRLGWNTRTDEAHCYNCGWGSKHYTKSKVLRKLQLSVMEVDAVVGSEGSAPPPEPVHLPKGFQRVTELDAKDDLEGIPLLYLKRRGITRAQMKRLKIGITLVGKYAYRIVFPVYANKHLEGFVSRDWTGDREPRYLNSKGERSLYNLGAFHGQDEVVLSEGIFKALYIENHIEGVCSLALLGHSITDKQLAQLEALKCKQVVVWPDPDKVGVQGAFDICDKLVEHRIDSYIICPPPTKQADELSPEQLMGHWLTRRPYDAISRARSLLAASSKPPRFQDFMNKRVCGHIG